MVDGLSLCMKELGDNMCEVDSCGFHVVLIQSTPKELWEPITCNPKLIFKPGSIHYNATDKWKRINTVDTGFETLRRVKFSCPIHRKDTQGSGVLQIGIRAWLQQLACLGSWTSCIKTIFKGILRVTPYLTSFLKSMVKLLLKKIMKLSNVCVFKKYEMCVVHKMI
jgi:hypothetical protein